MRKSLTNVCWDFQFRVVQRCDNLVDVDKCCKMSIYLQGLVPIQPRTSPLKFDHLVENFEAKYGIVSFNLGLSRGHRLQREPSEPKLCDCGAFVDNRTNNPGEDRSIEGVSHLIPDLLP